MSTRILASPHNPKIRNAGLRNIKSLKLRIPISFSHSVAEKAFYIMASVVFFHCPKVVVAHFALVPLGYLVFYRGKFRFNFVIIWHITMNSK